MDTTTRNKGGRPRKPADPNYPRRRASIEQRMKEKEGENVGDTNGNNGETQSSENTSGTTPNDSRPIVVGSESAKPEQKPPSPSKEDTETTNEIDPNESDDSQFYYCASCETPLKEGERYCSGCGTRLAWEHAGAR